MTTFKVGDRVVRINCTNDGLKIGDEANITGFSQDGGAFLDRGDRGLGHDLINLILVKSANNKNNMSIKESFLLAFKSEPEKSFRKTGITDGDDFFTDDGQKVFLSWLLKKHGAEFKKEIVDNLLAEMEKDK